jgi:hypothetical protein
MFSDAIGTDSETVADQEGRLDRVSQKQNGVGPVREASGAAAKRLNLAWTGEG